MVIAHYRFRCRVTPSHLPPAEVFIHHIQRPRLKGLFQALWNSYAVTFDEIRNRGDGKENIALRPQLQHANVQRAVREMAARYNGKGFSARDVPNTNGCEWHVEITAGPVTLTDHYLRNLSDAPRHAAYREALACSNDLSLFGAELIDVETPLYALLVHGFDARSAEERLIRTRPDFALVHFPVEQARSFAHLSINLFEMFPDVVQPKFGDREEIRDRAMPDFRETSFGDEE